MLFLQKYQFILKFAQTPFICTFDLRLVFMYRVRQKSLYTFYF